jgi:thiamine biosynthesis lipoprotein
VPPGKRIWTVGIQNPDRSGALLGTLDLAEGSVSSSAGYASFLTINGKRYGHILDPRTLSPTDASLSVTIWSPDGTLGDAVSKPAFILGPERGLALIDSFPRMLGLIAYRKPDGGIGVVMSQGLKDRFHPVSGT